MRLFHFIISVFLITSLQAQETDLLFNIIHKNNTIGTLTAKKKPVGENVHYYNHTAISTRILFANIEVDYQYTVVYNQDQLIKAAAKIRLNGNTRTNTFTEKNVQDYIFYENGKQQRSITENIAYSTVNLLFEEPLHIDKVYAEEHGEFHELKKIRRHTYEKINSKGKVNTYFYKNGILEKAVIDIGLINFEIIKK